MGQRGAHKVFRSRQISRNEGTAQRLRPFLFGSKIHLQRIARLPIGRDLQDGRAAQTAMREEQIFAKLLGAATDLYRDRDACQVAVCGEVFCRK